MWFDISTSRHQEVRELFSKYMVCSYFIYAFTLTNLVIHLLHCTIVDILWAGSSSRRDHGQVAYVSISSSHAGTRSQAIDRDRERSVGRSSGDWSIDSNSSRSGCQNRHAGMYEFFFSNLNVETSEYLTCCIGMIISSWQWIFKLVMLRAIWFCGQHFEVGIISTSPSPEELITSPPFLGRKWPD